MTRLGMAALLLVAVAQAQTTRDGIYTEAQAKRGEETYAKSCASCHAPDLSGSGQAPALADREFTAEWDKQPLADLFERIRTTMPADAPGTLKPPDVADVMAFLFSTAGMPSGRTELPSETAALKSITYAAPAPQHAGMAAEKLGTSCFRHAVPRPRSHSSIARSRSCTRSSSRRRSTGSGRS